MEMATKKAVKDNFNKQLLALARTAYVTDAASFETFRNVVKAMFPECPDDESDFIDWYIKSPYEFHVWESSQENEENEPVQYDKYLIGHTYNFETDCLWIPSEWYNLKEVQHAVFLLDCIGFQDGNWYQEEYTQVMSEDGDAGGEFRTIKASRHIRAFNAALKQDTPLGKFCRAVKESSKLYLNTFQEFVQDEEQYAQTLQYVCCNLHAYDSINRDLDNGQQYVPIGRYAMALVLDGEIQWAIPMPDKNPELIIKQLYEWMV